MISMQISERTDQMPPKMRKLSCEGEDTTVVVLYQWATVEIGFVSSHARTRAAPSYGVVELFRTKRGKAQHRQGKDALDHSDWKDQTKTHILGLEMYVSAG